MLLAGKASKGKIRSKETNTAIKALTREIQENKIAIDNWKNQVLVMGGKWATDVEEITEESEFKLKEYGTPEKFAEDYANNMKGLREIFLNTFKLKIPAEYVWDTKGYFRHLSGVKLTKKEEEGFRLTLAKKIISKEKRILKKILNQNIKGIHGYDDALGMAQKAYDMLQKSHDGYMEALNANADKRILKALAKDVIDAEETLLNTANVLISHKTSHNNAVASLDLSKHRAAYLWINEHYGGDPFFITEGKLSLAKLKEQAKEFKIRTTKGDTRKSIAQKIADKAFNATVDGHTFGVSFIVTDNLQEAKEKYATKVKSIVDTFRNAKVAATKTEGIVAFKSKTNKAFMRKQMKFSAQENLVSSIDQLIADINYGSFLPRGVKPENLLTSIDYTKVLKDETELGKLLNEHKKSSSRLTMATRAAPEIIITTPTAGTTIPDEDQAGIEAFTKAVEGERTRPLTPEEAEKLGELKESGERIEEAITAMQETVATKKEVKWEATKKIDKQIADVNDKLDKIREKYTLTDQQRKDISKNELKKFKKDMEDEFKPLLTQRSTLISKRSKILKAESEKVKDEEKSTLKKLNKLKGSLERNKKAQAALDRTEKKLGKRAAKKARAKISKRKAELFAQHKVEFAQAEKLAKDLDKFDELLIEIGAAEEEKVGIYGESMRQKKDSRALPTDKELQVALEEGSAARKRREEARKNAPPEVKSMRTKKFVGVRIKKPTDPDAKKMLKRLKKKQSDGSVPLEFNKIHYNHAVSEKGVDTILVYKNIGGKISELPLATVTIDNNKIHIDYFRSNITSSQSSEAMQKIENKEAVSIADVQAAVDIAISDTRSKWSKTKTLGKKLHKKNLDAIKDLENKIASAEEQLKLTKEEGKIDELNNKIFDLNSKLDKFGVREISEERLELVLTSRPTREGYDQPWFSDQEAEQYDKNVGEVDVIVGASVSNLQLKGKEAADVKKRFKPTEKIFKEQQEKSAETNAIIADLEKKIKSAEDKLKKERTKEQIKNLENKIFKLDNKLRTVRNEAFKHAGFSPEMPRIELKEEPKEFPPREHVSVGDFNALIKMQGDPFYSDQAMLKTQKDLDALQNANKRVLNLREDNKLECP